MAKLRGSLDQQATASVLKRIREEARLDRKTLSNRLGQRDNFVSLVEQSRRMVEVPELRPYALACGRDAIEVYALIVRETALYTTQEQSSATTRLRAAARRKSAKKKRS